jgi:hypothetical protein
MNTSTLDIDLDLLNKEALIKIILFAHEKDITFNKAIEELLIEFLNYSENKEFTTNS